MEVALFASALVMGFLGSWHCGVMCGPLGCNFKKNNHFIGYHMGRLVSYLSMGLILFYGSHYLMNVESRSLKVVTSLLFAGIFIYFGLKQLNILQGKGGIDFFNRFQFRLLKSTRTLTEKFPFILGLLTGLLPCAWLYSFLILASQMKSEISAMVLISIFWLTSLPAFFIFNKFIQGLIASSPMSYRRISGIVLIISGLFSLVGHWMH